jgi:hypothetical protein
MTAITDTAANRVVDWTLGNSATAPTGPMKLALLTANGSAGAAGTEVAGGSYARQTYTPGTAASRTTDNTGDISFTGMPACTVTGWEIYDSAGSPVRWWFGTFSSPRTYAAGDTAIVRDGDLDLTLD